MDERLRVRWEVGTFMLIADEIASRVEGAEEPWACTVDAIIVTENGKAKQGFIRLNQEDGGESFTANIGWPCPGRGCPDE